METGLKPLLNFNLDRLLNPQVELNSPEPPSSNSFTLEDFTDSVYHLIKPYLERHGITPDKILASTDKIHISLPSASYFFNPSLVRQLLYYSRGRSFGVEYAETESPLVDDPYYVEISKLKEPGFRIKDREDCIKSIDTCITQHMDPEAIDEYLADKILIEKYKPKPWKL